MSKKVLRVSPNPLARVREVKELERLMGQTPEIVNYPSTRSLDPAMVGEFARQNAVAVVMVSYYDADQRAKLVDNLDPTPLLGNLRELRPTRDRFGHSTSIETWSGLGLVDSDGHVTALADGELANF